MGMVVALMAVVVTRQGIRLTEQMCGEALGQVLGFSAGR